MEMPGEFRKAPESSVSGGSGVWLCGGAGTEVWVESTTDPARCGTELQAVCDDMWEQGCAEGGGGSTGHLYGRWASKKC